MKWSILGLILLGIVAAVSAAALVAYALHAANRKPASQAQSSAKKEVTVVVAAGDLTAPRQLNASDLVEKTMPGNEMPRGSVTSPLGVVGKVISRNLKKDEPITADCIATDAAGWRLSAVLPDGTRAISVNMDEDSGMAGLLSPGVRVDVIWVYSVRNESNVREDTVSTTLLQGVPVQGVDRQTVLNESPEPSSASSSVTSRNRTTVTLAVTPEQAQKIFLAKEQGKLQLSLRGALDDKSAKTPAIRWSELASNDRAEPMPLAHIEKAPPSGSTLSTGNPPAITPMIPVGRWETTVIRGSTSQVQSFSLETAGATNDK